MNTDDKGGRKKMLWVTVICLAVLIVIVCLNDISEAKEQKNKSQESFKKMQESYVKMKAEWKKVKQRTKDFIKKEIKK